MPPISPDHLSPTGQRITPARPTAAELAADIRRYESELAAARREVLMRIILSNATDAPQEIAQ